MPKDERETHPDLDPVPGPYADDLDDPDEPGGRKPVSECDIVLQNPSDDPDADDPALALWIERLVAHLAPEARSFGVRFASDREMRRLNRTYREKDYPTDVLSFPGEETPDGLHLGDVAIALGVARRQADEAEHPLGRELRLLLLHGVLHCLGYDHETDDGTMERLESLLREQWITPEAAAAPHESTPETPDGESDAGD